MDGDEKRRTGEGTEFAIGPKPEGNLPEGGTEITEGSVFSVGGVQSSLSRLVKSDKIPENSPIFSIGRENASQVGWKPVEGKYTIDREMARGGMGAILNAKDNDLRRFIAMKVMLRGPGASQQEYERFVKEAQVTGFLEHPNIVPVHELGVDRSSRPFFTMKLVGGESLKSILTRIWGGDESHRARYSQRKLLGIFIQVCNAVSFAHSRGVIHRDLKPENIMVGDFGEVLVMDWGLAKIRNVGEIQVQIEHPLDGKPTQTIEGSVIGTPAYMPPEQARGALALTDERSDVFSLGAILYEILVGEPPYTGSVILEVLGKAAKAEIVPPQRLRKISPDLERICLTALQSQPADRFQSVREMAGAIESYLDHRVIPEYSVRLWEKILQSAGIIAVGFALAILVYIAHRFNLSGIIGLLDYPSALTILLVGLGYQLIANGDKLSLFGRLRRSNRSTAQAAGSQNLQVGFLLGGLLGLLIGMFAMGQNLNEKERLGFGMGLALISSLYFVPLYFIIRLEHLREARRGALFGLISSNNPANLVQVLLLLIMPCFCQLGFLIAFPEWGRKFLALMTGNILRNVVLTSLLFIILAFTAGIMYFRMIFTFHELWAAIGHLFTFLAGGEVDRENQVHASSVIRFLVESVVIWVIACGYFLMIGTLQQFSTLELLHSRFLSVVCTSFVALLFYILVNHVLLRWFAGDGGYREDRLRLGKIVTAFYREHYGRYWSETRRGAMAIALGTLLVVAPGVSAMIFAKADMLRSLAFLSYACIGCVALLANITRARERKFYHSQEADAERK